MLLLREDSLKNSSNVLSIYYPLGTLHEFPHCDLDKDLVRKVLLSHFTDKTLKSESFSESCKARELKSDGARI